jgi:hypothetical protein
MLLKFWNGNYSNMLRITKITMKEVCYWHLENIWLSLAVGGGTILQAGRSRVRFPMRSLNFFAWPHRPSLTMAPGSTQPLTEMSTKNLPGDKGRPVRKDDNLTALFDNWSYNVDLIIVFCSSTRVDGCCVTRREPGELSRYSDGLGARQFGVYSRQRQGIFLYSTATIYTFGTAQSPIHCVLGAISLG